MPLISRGDKDCLEVILWLYHSAKVQDLILNSEKSNLKVSTLVLSPVVTDS